MQKSFRHEISEGTVRLNFLGSLLILVDLEAKLERERRSTKLLYFETLAIVLISEYLVIDNCYF